jgi:phosphoglycolate phosphatase-like HAD superfamily hydrolase
MKLFVWDFHGVLEKDNEKAVIEISNHILADAGFKERFTEEDNERFYGLKWHQYFERLLPNLSHEECIELQAKCFRYAEKRLDILAKYIKPNDHAIDVLSKIADQGHQQIVISNSRQSDLIWFLKSVGAEKFFDEQHIVGVNAHQKHGSKSDALKDYLRGKQFDQIVVIGDSEDDMKLGSTVKGTTYFYKHPHRTHEDTRYANYIIKDLREVLDEVNPVK